MKAQEKYEKKISLWALELAAIVLYEKGLTPKKVILLIWDNAPWHKSKQVRSWIKQYNKVIKSKIELEYLNAFYLLKSFKSLVKSY